MRRVVRDVPGLCGHGWRGWSHVDVLSERDTDDGGWHYEAAQRQAKSLDDQDGGQALPDH